MASPRKMLVIDGKMAVNNGRMVTTDAADCCCGDTPCDVPPVLSVCAAYDLFNLPPANASENFRHQILLPMATRTAITVNMRAQIDWSSRGGEQLFDIVAYRLKDGTNNDASENIKLYPAIQKDAGGCWRVVEWRNVAYIELDRVVNMDGNYLSIPFQACVRLRMTANGWLLFIEPTDPVASDNGTFTCRRSNGSTDSVSAAADAQHQSTFKGFGQTREPFASQVTGGLGRMLQVALTDYSAPDPNVVPTGCPPYSGVQFVRATSGSVCDPGLVTFPGRYRIRYTSRRVYTPNVGAPTIRDRELVWEVRRPTGSGEALYTIVNNVGMSVGLNAATESMVIGWMVTHLQTFGVTGSVDDRDTLDFVGFYNGVELPCADKRSQGSFGGAAFWEFSGTDSITTRTATQLFGRVGNYVETLTKSIVLEPIDVLICENQPGALVAIPPPDVARAKLAAYFGRML